MRNDSNKPFWKEKFVNGLPSLFAHKVREELSKNLGYIDYDNLTYGDIISYIQKIGLKMCIDFKLAKQASKDKKKAKYELGTFCEQYGLPPVAPSRRKHRHSSKHIESHKTHRRKKRKYIYTDKNSKEIPDKKSKSTRKKSYKKSTKYDKSKIVCHNCGQKGHYKNECRVKKKLSQMNVSAEDTEEILELMRIEQESSNNEDISNAETSNYDTDSNDESNSDNEVTICTANCNNEDCCKTVNVINKDDEESSLLIELISKITDPSLKTQYLKQLKDLLTKDTKVTDRVIKAKEKPIFSINKTLERFKTPVKEITLPELNHEVNKLKKEISGLKLDISSLRKEFEDNKSSDLQVNESSCDEDQDIPESSGTKIEPINEPELAIQGLTLKRIKDITIQKWYISIKLVINNTFSIRLPALVDTGADLNCIQEGLVPTRYYEKTRERLNSANGSQMEIKYKLPKVHICQDDMCFKTSFVLVSNLTDKIILGLPFIYLLYPFTTSNEGLSCKHLGKKITFKFLVKPKERDLKFIQEESISKSINLLNCKITHLKFLKEEVKYQQTEEQLKSPRVQQKISELKDYLIKNLCSDSPNAFWHRKKHVVRLPYAKEFKEHLIPTKARPIQMSHAQMELCKNEINDLLSKGLIRHSKSPWSCPAFYVNNEAEKERGVPRLVINYKPLNKVLEWIRYPLPNKDDLLSRLSVSTIFSKFDLKSGFWQVAIHPDDRYKTAFTTPFGHYEWNVQSFGLKNAPSEFQNILNNILNPFSHFIIVYIDDILVFSKTIEEHIKHLNSFFHSVKVNGLVLSPSKCSLFLTKVRFLGLILYHGLTRPIERAIQFADRFPDKITDKNQLQRFLGSLNYIGKFYKNLRKICKPLFQRLQLNPPPWTDVHTSVVQQVKKYVKVLPCLGISNDSAFKIVETDASNIGFGGILKQKLTPTSEEQIVLFHSGAWNPTQLKYSTIKKEILSLVLCIKKFQKDLLNQKFLVRIDCKSAKFILEKDVENVASKHSFARWQAILSIFDFDIEYIKGSNNSVPDFLTREFINTGTVT